MIHCNSTTQVEFAGKISGQFLMERGVRQRCPANGFLFALAFDPIFRWLQDTIIPNNTAAPDFLQPPSCAYADDFAVGALSFQLLMTALSPAFVVVDRVARHNLNHRKCYWAQYGSGSCHELLNWVGTNCEELCEMKIVKYANYVGTMIGPEGYLHRWAAPRKQTIQRTKKINESTKSLVERWVDFKIYALSVLGYLGSISAPEEATLKEELCSVTRCKNGTLPYQLIAARTPKVFGLISRHLTAQNLPRMSDASRASLPMLVVGILRVLCNGVCTAQRFQMEGVKNKDAELGVETNLTLSLALQ